MKLQNIIFPLMMKGVSHATTFSIDPSMDFIAALKAAQAGDTLKFEAGNGDGTDCDVDRGTRPSHFRFQFS